MPDSAALFAVHGASTPPPGPATYLVLGNARGGTSMCAGLLRLLGIPLGESYADAFNEDVDFLFHGGNVSTLTSPATRESSLDWFREVIRRRQARFDVWGWKDPLIHLYLRPLLPDLRHPRLIVIHRDPLSVAINQFEKVDRAIVPELADVLATYRDHLDLIRGGGAPALVAGYETVLRNPERFVDALCRFTGRTLDEPGRVRAVAYVRPSRGDGNLATLRDDLRAFAEVGR